MQFEAVLDYPALSPVKEQYVRYVALPQIRKAKLFGVASVLSFFMFLMVLIVLVGTTTKSVTSAKTAVVVFMETLPEDLLALRYLLMRPDYYTAAIVVSGSGLASNLKPSSENLEKFLTLMATEGNKGAANVPVYYGTSFSTSPAQRISTAASTLTTLPTSPLSRAASFLNNLTKVIGAPDDPKSCSMTSRFVEDDVLYRGDTLYGARMYLPARKVGLRGYVDRTDTASYAATLAAIKAQGGKFGGDPRSSEPFFLDLAHRILYPLQQQGVSIKAIVFGPTTDLVTLLRRSYNPAGGAAAGMPNFPVRRIFDQIVIASGAFGTASGDVGTYVSTTLATSGPLNAHAQLNFFFDAPSAHTLIEGGTEYNDLFSATMSPIVTLVPTNAAVSAAFTQSSYNTIVEARASTLTTSQPTANGVALKGISNCRKVASAQPPFYTMDLSAPLDLLAAVVLTNPAAAVKTSVVDRVHVNDDNLVSGEGITGKGSRSTSTLRTVVLAASSGKFWSIAQSYLFQMPNPRDV